MLRAAAALCSLCAALLLPLSAEALPPASSAAGAEAARRALSVLPSAAGDTGSAHYVLHFGSRAPPHHHLAAALGSSHVQPLGGGRFEVHASRRALQQALADGQWGLHRAEPMRPRRKLHSALRSPAAFRRRGAALSAANASAPRALVAVVSGVVDAEALRASLEARGVAVRAMRHVRQQVHFALRNPDQAPRAARLLAERDEVRWLEPQTAMRSLNHIATWSVQSDTPGQRPLWRPDRGIDGTGEVVQIGDTGLDYNSCFFRDDDQTVAFWPKSNMNHRKVVGYKECIRPDDLRRFHEDRPHAHGTHVSGSVAGNSVEASQTSSNGLAYKAKIHFTDMACDEPDLGLPVDMADYHGMGREVGAHVSHNSWGMDTPTEYITLDRQTDKYMYDHQDFLAVYAAGNSPSGGILSPSNAKNGLTVGAHNNNEHRDALAGFSAHGPTWDQRRKPEIVAPGQPVLSAASDGPGDGRQCTTEQKSGTSMAAPFVSASAVLLRQYFRAGWHPSGTRKAEDAFEPTAPLLKALIVQSAQPIVAGNAGTPPNSLQGFGRLALQYITRFADDYPVNHMLLVNNASVMNEAAYSKCFSVDPAAAARVGEVRATMVWMDPPPPEGARRTLINDLDLTLHTPDGRMLRARGTSGDYDPDNLVEQVLLSNPPPGVYRVTVFGHSVLEHAPYADGLPFAIAMCAPGIQEVPCSEAACPADCGAHGVCEDATKMCRCDQDWIHQDCSKCSALSYCHGHGKCTPAGGDNLQCTCDEHFAAPRCAGCDPGWYGPDCAGDCNCGSRGHCDQVSGQCVCLDSEEDGHWGGVHCDICKDGWRGAGCLTPSHWCRNHQLVSIDNEFHGWLQLNGGTHYPNSLSCRYHIHSPNGHPIVMHFSHHVEDSYDFISVFRGTDENGIRLFYETGQGQFSASIEGGDAYVLFESDMYDEGGQVGFSAEFQIGGPTPAGSAAPVQIPTSAPLPAPTPEPTPEPPPTPAPTPLPVGYPSEAPLVPTPQPSASPAVPPVSTHPPQVVSTTSPTPQEGFPTAMVAAAAAVAFLVSGFIAAACIWSCNRARYKGQAIATQEQDNDEEFDPSTANRPHEAASGHA